MKNTEMNLMKCFGIFFVVAGHLGYQPLLAEFLPAYSFHIVIFFFISGFFYNEKYENNFARFIRTRFQRLLLPYFVYNLLYGLLMHLLFAKKGLTFGLPPSPLNVRSLLVEPFITGHQFFLFIPAWFVPQLLIVQFIYLIYRKFSRSFVAGIYGQMLFPLAVCVCGLYFAQNPIDFNVNPLKGILIRTSFSMFFYGLGLFYRQISVSNDFLRSYYLIPMCVFQYLLIRHYHDISYELVWCRFRGHIAAPILAGVFGIYIGLWISKTISSVMGNNNPIRRLLDKIGESTFHVMSNHLFIFFLINYAFLTMKGLNIDVLNNIWYAYNKETYWLLYIAAGLLLPTLLAAALTMVRERARKVMNHLYRGLAAS